MNEVTLVVPVYNRSAFLPLLFKSIEAVTYSKFRVILVDNNSTDDSLLLCQEYAHTSRWNVEVLQEAEKGAAKARNCGLSACQTEWIYFFDSDDELSPDIFDILIPLGKDYDVVFCPTLMEVEGQTSIRAYKATCQPAYQILSSMLCTPSTLYRTAWLREIGGWNPKLTVWDDWELGVRTLIHSPRALWYTDKPFHHVYVHNESITGPNMAHNLKGKLDCMLQVSQLLASQDGTPSKHAESGSAICKSRKALYLRYCIFKGKLKHEGHGKLLQEALNDFPEAAVLSKPYPPLPLTVRLLGYLLYLFTSVGGRGAWRLATYV